MSKSEGLNNCIMEAGATGVPVITTKTGAVEEMIKDMENGCIIDRNVDILVNRIRFFMNNRNTIKVFGDRLMEVITKDWSWNKKIEDYKRMFNEFFKNH
jgi:glycosyltransferase involved in cell wall biosynthesis